MTTSGLRFALATALLLPALAAPAQREGYAYLSYVGSEVSLVSVAEDDSSARTNTPILAGDRVSTGAGSRAEAILADGNVLRIDVQTSLRFDRLAKTYEAEDDRNSVYLERGAISLEHRWSTSRDAGTRIDTDDATILFPEKGVLRVETGRRGTEVYVVSGRAEVNARSGRATLRAGQYVYASGEAELEVDSVDEPRDRFARFVDERRDLYGSGSRAGTRYVTADYDYDYAVADFDRYGSWVTIGGSSCWRPTVSVGWRPYEEGYWRWSPAGLTWVSYEPWGWLPYHYGSWIWDVGFGWCWTPGLRYSPAWVYWNYTPSWVGWCPIGYYGGYYGSYYRSGRNWHGAERWTNAYPHLRGRVDVTQIDPRGWSYASVNRLGSRFDVRRDVLRADSVRFQPGERGLVATSPLRIDRGRGGSATAVVQAAVRRVPQTVGAEPRGGRGLDDITPVLRRDGTLGTTAREGLRNSFVTPGQDPGYRPVSADQLAAPRRDVAGGSTAGLPSRGGERGLGPSPAPARGGDVSAPGREAPREAWRGAGGVPETRGARGADATPRRDAGQALEGGFGRGRTVRGDDGWRSPGSDARSGARPSRTFDVPARRPDPATEGSDAPTRAGRREAAPAAEPWRSTSQPPARRDGASGPDAGATSPGRREPAPRSDEGWRGADTPSRGSHPVEAAPSPRGESPTRSWDTPSRGGDSRRSAPAPRMEAPPSRYEAPTRSYEPPRSAPAPRYEPPPSRSYSPPARSHDGPRSAPAPRYEAPPSRSYEGPRSAPAPRYEAPSRSNEGSSHRSSPPPSRSGDGPHSRSVSPRG